MEPGLHATGEQGRCTAEEQGRHVDGEQGHRTGEEQGSPVEGVSQGSILGRRRRWIPRLAAALDPGSTTALE